MSRSSLRDFTDDELLIEMVRRRNQEPVAKPEFWCHNCAHFVAWNERKRVGSMPPDFSPCTKGHQMKFIVPADYGEEYGFYRRVCGDRADPPDGPQPDERR